MATVSTKLMSADAFFDWASLPEHQDRLWELERGEAVEMPSPGELHGILCGFIAHLLWSYVVRRGRGGAVSSNDTGLLIEEGPDTVRGPDLMLFDESLPLEKLSRRYTRRIPRLVVEVRSPTDQPTRMTRRAGDYLRRGVPLVWLVDPEVRSVTVCRPDRFPSVLDETDTITGEEVLPDLTMRVAEFFALPEQSAGRP